jgi:hypothetical protein
MTSSNYPFLARNQKTEEERQKENIDALWDRLGVIGLPGKQSFFTGYGNDKQLQPERPTGILNTNQGPKTVHEGEQVNIEPDGQFGVIPASQLGGQENLQTMERENNMEGYQLGKSPDDNTIIDDTYKPYTTRGLQRLERYADYESPVNTAIREGERERFAGEAVAAKGALAQEQAQMGIKGREAATEEARLGRQIGAQENELMSNLRKQESEQAFTAARQLPGEAVTARGVDFERQKYGDQEFTRMADDAQTTSFETWQQKYPNATEEDYTTAREYKARQLQSMDIANLTASENLNQLKKSDKWNDAQQFLNAGDYDNYAALVKQITGRTLNYTQFVEDRDYVLRTREQTITAGDIANDAARYGLNDAEMQSVIRDVNSGVPVDTINSQYGTEFTQDDRDSIAARYDSELLSLKNRVGDEVYNSLQEMINGGSSLEAINDRARYYGMGEISTSEYMKMLDATPLGERTWERNLQYSNMLLQSQDPDNIIKAQRILKELFPFMGYDVTFDVDQLINDIGAERFAGALTDMSTLASTYDTWEEAKASAEGLNLIETLGGGFEDSEGNAMRMFQSLKMNAVDEQWDAIEQSDFYQGLLRSNPDGAELIRQTFTKGLTGELEFDIKPVYNVTDENGAFVQSFDNIVDANKFLGENADKGYIVNESSNYIYKDIVSGDTVTVNNQTGTTTTNEKEEPTSAELYDKFLETVPSGVTPPKYEVWLNADKPKNYDSYQGEATPVNILDSIDVTSYSELLDRNNSSTLWDAYGDDPKAVEDSEYFYEFPVAGFINSNVNTSIVGSRMFGQEQRETRLSEGFKKTLDDSVGKLTTIDLTTKTTKAEKTGESITGQVISYRETPNTVEIDLKMEDGTTKSVSITPALFKGDPPMIILK